MESSFDISAIADNFGSYLVIQGLHILYIYISCYNEVGAERNVTKISERDSLLFKFKIVN